MSSLTKKISTKRISQRSGTKVLLAGFIGIIIGYLPQLTDMLMFPPPWDGIVPIIIGFVVATLKLLQSQISDPSVAARNLPESDNLVRPNGVPVLFDESGKVRK